MYIRQIAAATAIYAVLAIFGALNGLPNIVPGIDLDAGARAGQAVPAAAKTYILETEILHLREENIIP